MKHRKLIIGNRKMNGTRDNVTPLIQALHAHLPADGAVDVTLCVPFPFLETTERLLAGSALDWGAQNLSPHASGAHTGEVSASMLRDFGCRYVLVGHSERRDGHGESDQADGGLVSGASLLVSDFSQIVEAARV